ncbi:hypothetical protein F4804DRAFT_314002 [Jackrogersella minutella]|nr:hypothetical protein F4804DRAFT_314002 [Jackrogersella minutella]
MRISTIEDPIAHEYLPHIVHFYAKSREHGWRYLIPHDWNETFGRKYALQRLIDTWNRMTYIQTYWDPDTGINPRKRRRCLITDDNDFYMYQGTSRDTSTSSDSAKRSKQDSSQSISSFHSSFFPDDMTTENNIDLWSIGSFEYDGEFEYDEEDPSAAPSPTGDTPNNGVLRTTDNTRPIPESIPDPWGVDYSKGIMGFVKRIKVTFINRRR